MNEENNIDNLDNYNSDLSFSTSDEHNNLSEHSFSILQFILNCLLHSTILFFFLYFLFIVLIAPLAQNGFKHEFNHIIHEIFDHMIHDPINLSSMNDNDFDKLISTIYPEYSSLDPITKFTLRNNLRQLINLLTNQPYIIKNYMKQYSSPNFLIQQHNDNINEVSIAIILFLVVLIILLCISFKYFYPNDINLSKLFIENIITFIFIGIGEYWFFTTYASKFIPAPPSLLSKSAIDTIKERFLQS